MSLEAIETICQAEEAAKMAISSPLLETSIEGARGVLINITGSPDIGLEEVETAANLVQEARNGKGKARIFIYPKSAMLKAKAASLEGYVTNNATVDVVIEKIREFEDNIGTKI